MARDATGLALEEHIGVALRQAYQHAVANLVARIGEFELSPMQFSVLVRLHDLGPFTQNALGRSILMEPANIRALVQRLAGRGLVELGRDEGDRRVVLVRISEEGRGLLEAARPHADAANAGTLGVLAPEEQAQLFALLRRLIDG